jgi:hypothetical protein
MCCLSVTVFHNYVGKWPSVAFHQICWFCVFTCLDCFIAIVTSIPHFILDLLLPYLPSGHQVSITFGRLLPPTYNTLPYHFTSYLPFFPKLFVFSHFSLILRFLSSYYKPSFAASFQKSRSGLDSFFFNL